MQRVPADNSAKVLVSSQIKRETKHADACMLFTSRSRTAADVSTQFTASSTDISCGPNPGVLGYLARTETGKSTKIGRTSPRRSNICYCITTAAGCIKNMKPRLLHIRTVYAL